MDPHIPTASLSDTNTVPGAHTVIHADNTHPPTFTHGSCRASLILPCQLGETQGRVRPLPPAAPSTPTAQPGARVWTRVQYRVPRSRGPKCRQRPQGLEPRGAAKSPRERGAAPAQLLRGAARRGPSGEHRPPSPSARGTAKFGRRAPPPHAAGAPAQPRPDRPPRSPMWMMESARTDTHWHIQGRSHSVSASMSPGRAAHPPGPGARPRAARSGEAPVRVQSRAAPRESRARPCVFSRAPAPAPCARPSPAQPSAVGLPLPLWWWLRRRWQPEPRPVRRGRPAAAAAALPAARAASEAAEAVAAAAGPARRLRARCVSEPRRGANCGGRPLPSPSPSAPLPLPSLPASLPSALLSAT